VSEVEAAVSEPSSEVKEDYVNLQVSLGAFMEAMQAAMRDYLERHDAFQSFLKKRGVEDE
jgi:hypothetical protein